MGMPLWWTFVAFTFLFMALMAMRMRVERLRAAVDDAFADAEG
jgi:hypothetical protein